MQGLFSVAIGTQSFEIALRVISLITVYMMGMEKCFVLIEINPTTFAGEAFTRPVLSRNFFPVI
jgi:hypothetical protein